MALRPCHKLSSASYDTHVPLFIRLHNLSLSAGERLREANAINTSLTTLGTVMASLASKSKHVPFRDSKLTQLLADSLQGQAKVLMFMHIAPEGSSLSESISTLNFGSRVATVTLGQVGALGQMRCRWRARACATLTSGRPVNY